MSKFTLQMVLNGMIDSGKGFKAISLDLEFGSTRTKNKEKNAHHIS